MAIGDLRFIADVLTVVPTVRVHAATAVSEYRLTAMRQVTQDRHQFVGNLDGAFFPCLRLPVWFGRHEDDASLQVNVVPRQVLQLSFAQTSHQIRLEDRRAPRVAMAEELR